MKAFLIPTKDPKAPICFQVLTAVTSSGADYESQYYHVLVIDGKLARMCSDKRLGLVYPLQKYIDQFNS